MHKSYRKVILVQGTPVVPSWSLDLLTAEHQAFLQIDLGRHYARGTATAVQLCRFGDKVQEYRVPVPQVPRTGLRRLVMLPSVYWRYGSTVLGALRRFAGDIRGGRYVARLWSACLFGLLARRLGWVDSVVYWVGDVYPVVGSWDTRLVVRLYWLLERYCVTRADEVWYATQRIRDAHVDRRGRRWRTGGEHLQPGLNDNYPMYHVPIQAAADRYRFVYAGTLQKGQGLELLIPAMARLAKDWPGIHLDVFGDGPDAEAFQRMAAGVGAEGCVTFHGHVSDGDLRSSVARATAGFALYDPMTMYHAAYTVTSKAYLYLGCGIPVIIGTCAGSYPDVMATGAGVSSWYQVDCICESVATCLANSEFLRTAARSGFDKMYGVDATSLRKLWRT